MCLLKTLNMEKIYINIYFQGLTEGLRHFINIRLNIRFGIYLDIIDTNYRVKSDQHKHDFREKITGH